MSKPGTRIGVVTSMDASAGPPASIEALPTGMLNWEAVGVDHSLDRFYYRKNGESAAALEFNLKQSRDRKYPLYLEFSNDRLERIRIPKIDRVTQLEKLEGGALRVGLSSNAKTLIVPPGTPDTARITQICQISYDEKRGIVLVDEGYGTTILDADFAVGSSIQWIPAAASAKPQAPPEPPLTTRYEVDQALAALNTATCDMSLSAAAIVGGDCIGYNGPAGTCHTLAQATCEYLTSHHIPSQKAWLFGSLRLKTRNSPSCYFESTWHVAATVRINVGGVNRAYVIDPSARSILLSYSDWVDLFGTQITSRAPSAADIYTLNAQGYGVPFSQSQFDNDLYNLRWNLANNTPRPPFACASAL